MNLPVAAQPENMLVKMIFSMEAQFKTALPKSSLNSQRFMRIAMTEIRRNPALLECKPVSVIAALMQSAQLGLEPGFGGKAYLIPFKNECQLIIGYRGLLELARRSGEIKTIYAVPVYEGDDFQISYGTNPGINHLPTGKSDKVKAVYAVATFKDGGFQFEVMSTAQIDAHRNRYSKSIRSDSPWNTEWTEMARKTVLRKLLKMLPSCTEAQTAIDYEEELSKFTHKEITNGADLPAPGESDMLYERLDKLAADAQVIGMKIDDLDLKTNDPKKVLALCQIIETRLAAKQ